MKPSFGPHFGTVLFCVVYRIQQRSSSIGSPYEEFRSDLLIEVLQRLLQPYFPFV